ncbi:MAG: helix-turn-helix transcriptional regulator [Candidatus Aenigmarchaeota archaeon]|nr:helix-turn-helix transcriptional regulator [Candidatus Aenigmarchaeota archaeon]
METAELKCDMKGRGTCPLPLENMLDDFRKKWALSLIITLGNFGKLHFNAIHNRLKDKHTKKISPKVLSARLKELERSGFVRRKVHEKPYMIKYFLTRKGRQMYKIFLSVGLQAKEN